MCMMTTSRARRSISHKFRRLVVLAVGTAVLFIGAFGIWTETGRYASEKRDTFLATAGAFAAASAGAVAARDESAIIGAIRGIARVPTFSYAAVEDLEGRVLAEMGGTVRLEGDLDLTADARVSPLTLVTTGTIAVSVPIVAGGENVGRFKLVSEAGDLPGRLLLLLLTDAVGALIALGIGLLISLRLQRSITRPIVTLSKVMSDIEVSHDYGTAVTVESDDEVGVLAGTFNGMIREIRDRDERLAHHLENLEREVADRTRDLKVAKDEAEAANAAKSDFLATMSHEIRTPMNGLLVMAELLAGANLPKQQKRYAEVISRSGKSLLAIINDILDVSKIEAGHLTLEQIAFDQAEVVDTVMTLFAERAASKRLDLAAYVAPDLPRELLGDPVRVTQVLSNLVNNALKFAETGHVLIKVEWTADGRSIRFGVADTGIGIPDEKIATIFQAFTQADQTTTRRYGGTGLGLAICKKLVDAMGGEIGVTSVLGQGSEFYFTLPTTRSAERPEPAAVPVSVCVLMDGAATEAALTASLKANGFRLNPRAEGCDLIASAADVIRSGRPAGAGRVIAIAAAGDESGAAALRLGLADALLRWPVVQSEWREVMARLGRGEPFGSAALPVSGQTETPAFRFAGLRVLVADDTAINREVACEALSRLGIQADAVEDGRAAVESVLSGLYDAVLMDGSMPVLDGYDATRLIRDEESRSGRPRTCVIALTAHVFGPAAEAWRVAGMDDVLHKPFTIAQLTGCLDRLFPGRGSAVGTKTELPEVAAGEAVLDEHTLAGLADLARTGRDGFLDRILALFREHGPNGIEAIRGAAAAGDAPALASAAHRLKSMSLNVGGAALAEVLGRIETEARDERAMPTPATLDEAERLTQATIAALDLWETGIRSLQADAAAGVLRVA
jgi:signal transduction histidine kinase/CheY-like chemotaxis protein